jgi:hypothetical protein
VPCITCKVSGTSTATSWRLHQLAMEGVVHHRQERSQAATFVGSKAYH